MSNDELVQRQAQHNSDEIRDLRAEVAQLRGLLSKLPLQHQSASDTETLRLTTDDEFGLETVQIEDRTPVDVTNTELSDPREKAPRGFYGQHTLMQFFEEVGHRPRNPHSNSLICR